MRCPFYRHVLPDIPKGGIQRNPGIAMAFKCQPVGIDPFFHSSLCPLPGVLPLKSFSSDTREAPTVSPKSLLISGAKNGPCGHGEVLLPK